MGRETCMVTLCITSYLSCANAHELLEKFNNKRSESKYLSNFRKRNQTRFYD